MTRRLQADVGHGDVFGLRQRLNTEHMDTIAERGF